MPRVVITLEDQPTGEVSVHTDFTPAVGAPCSAAQAAALDVIARTRKFYGMPPLLTCQRESSPTTAPGSTS